LILVGLVVLVPRRHVQLYKVTVLPSLGATFTRPEAINNRGQVAGLAEVVGGRTPLFFWDRENGMQDLGPGYSPDINNRGCIVGVIRSRGLGNELGVLLEPIARRWGK